MEGTIKPSALQIGDSSDFFEEGLMMENRDKVLDEELFRALRKITVYRKGLGNRLWYKKLRTVSVENIFDFLDSAGSRMFSRADFADYLKDKTNSKTSKYKAAGDYLKILVKNKIVVHNGEKANRSAYCVSPDFIRHT